MPFAGFIHEHSRSDRDQYIKVMEDDLLSKHGFRTTNYRRCSGGVECKILGAYDFESIMHYNYRQLSRATDRLVEVFTPNKSIISDAVLNMMGQRKGLSNLDVEKIHKLYNCGIVKFRIVKLLIICIEKLHNHQILIMYKHKHTYLIDPCNPDPCNGHGTCSDNNGRFECKCNEGWSGNNCSKGNNLFLI